MLLLLFFCLLFLGLIGYWYFNIRQSSSCDNKYIFGPDWKNCSGPGGSQNKDKCTCDCKPGYEGHICQTKNKNVSDLETTCKGKTGESCVSCLEGWIIKNLSGSGTDVQDFKENFSKNLVTINNFCCQKNCSNVSDCKSCVQSNMKSLSSKLVNLLQKNNINIKINNKGCILTNNNCQKISYSNKKEEQEATEKLGGIPGKCLKDQKDCIYSDKYPNGSPFKDSGTKTTDQCIINNTYIGDNICNISPSPGKSPNSHKLPKCPVLHFDKCDPKAIINESFSCSHIQQQLEAYQRIFNKNKDWPRCNNWYSLEYNCSDVQKILPSVKGKNCDSSNVPIKYDS